MVYRVRKGEKVSPQSIGKKNPVKYPDSFELTMKGATRVAVMGRQDKEGGGGGGITSHMSVRICSFATDWGGGEGTGQSYKRSKFIEK